MNIWPSLFGQKEILFSGLVQMAMSARTGWSIYKCNHYYNNKYKQEQR